MGASISFWVIFNAVIFTILALDLGVFNKRAHKIAVKEALIWSSVWIAIALIFNIFVFFQFGKTRALEFLTGYVIEYSLSVDNIFVFILIFSYFSVKPQYQHKILFWGIIRSPDNEGNIYFCRSGSDKQIPLDRYYFW